MGKVWLITGSGSGLGRAITEAALAAGDQAVAGARKPQDLNALVERYGDPRRIADVVVMLSNTEEVPKRLVLGKDAETYVALGEAARAKETAKYRDLTCGPFSG